jgi:histidine triad (HIT) family protein
VTDILARLEAMIAARREALSRDPGLVEHSYVARQIGRGRLKLAQKLGEEAAETMIAAVAQDDAALASEAADLLFHLLLVLGERRVALADVFFRLEAREGRSGLAERAQAAEEKAMTVKAIEEYNPQNVFAKILRGEIPCRKVHETEHALAFHDINPQAPVHVLVIPKAAYVSMADFTAHAPTELVAGFFRAVGETARILGLEEPGYRILANAGPDSHQEVPHLHVHIFGGGRLGPMLAGRPVPAD